MNKQTIKVANKFIKKFAQEGTIKIHVDYGGGNMGGAAAIETFEGRPYTHEVPIALWEEYKEAIDMQKKGAIEEMRLIQEIQSPKYEQHTSTESFLSGDMPTPRDKQTV